MYIKNSKCILRLQKALIYIEKKIVLLIFTFYQFKLFADIFECVLLYKNSEAS